MPEWRTGEIIDIVLLEKRLKYSYKTLASIRKYLFGSHLCIETRRAKYN